MADLDEALKKKGGLTLDQLGKYDDICTDTLVDRVYFWSKIRKLDSNARPLRGAPSEDVCNILQKTCIVKKDAIGAQKEILQLQGLVGYMRTLKTADEKEHFERHMRKYINIYLPDCPFEVCTTNRYTVTTEEACVVARKTIRPGETIKYLSGIQVEMTEQEEKKLSSRTDFSIVLSSRRKRPSLFLGPARFANHDCDSNAKLTTTGPHGIVIVACKNIAVGDEISVSYGNNYFGVDNCECLCATCERLARNGWDPRGPILHDSSDEEESDEEIEQPARKKQRTTGVTQEERSASKPTASRTNKRKIDADEEEENGDEDADLGRPNKRGRPRKILKQPEVIEPVRTTSYAIEVLKLWFRARASQTDVDAKIDVEKIMREASGTLGDFIPEDKKHYGKMNEMLKVLVENNEADVEHAKKRLSSLRTQNAALLGISEKEAEKYYAPPGHPSYVSLPTPPRDLSDTDGKQSVLDESGDVLKDGSKTRELTPDSIGSNIEAGYEKNLKMSSNKRKRPLPAASRQHAASPLRKVTSVDDQKLVQESTKQESPARSFDIDKISPMETRGRSRRQSMAKNQVRNGNASQPNTSTQGSSPSSIFTGDGMKSASPETSVDDTDRFMTGSISQNIIDMYTSAGPDEGSSNDAVPSRARTRRQTSSTLNEDTIQSIEQPSHHKHRHNDVEDAEERRGEPRVPGDYQLTESLLVDLHDRWVECRNCDQFFVQHDAYLTRINCSRCERHSKLYGFYWPKTDKAGKDDKDERVLDHRLIHRFIEPDEERNERKGRRTAIDMLKEIDVRNSREAESRTRSASTEDNRRRSRRFVA